nr:unnamed protein product [Spirometra erinaceieuropaei]
MGVDAVTDRADQLFYVRHLRPPEMDTGTVAEKSKRSVYLYFTDGNHIKVTLTGNYCNLKPVPGKEQAVVSTNNLPSHDIGVYSVELGGRTYKLIKGTPMGSPISSLIAKLILRDLEKVAFVHYEPAFWHRYADAFVISERIKLADFQDLLNSIFLDIHFTRADENAE